MHENRNLGMFRLDRASTLVEGSIEYKFLQEVKIIKQDFNKETGAISYVANSAKHFHKLKRGGKIPTYSLYKFDNEDFLRAVAVYDIN